ncbi:MAG: NADPH:quinone oxidoreductase family protein [Alphaproteobacteria bacterium]|nr:MAG: NADPH:quinone oxidoreductase family protein [Alphaproteobacteria bacterium]
MKAVLCKEYGPIENLVVEEVPTPEPGPGQVRIDVKAAAVNFPDVLIVQNLYQFKPEPPFSPGGEVSGVVGAVGEGVTHVKPGDRVIGSAGFGGFAEQVVLDAPRVIPIGDHMPFDEAAAFVMVYGTSHHALKQRAELKPGDTLLVLGASGGVGLAAVELGKVMGAKVIAACSSQEKVDVCLKHGADDGFVYPRNPLDRAQQKALSDKIKELTGGKGADVIYDPVGDDYAEPALRAIAWKGRYLVVGFAAGEIPRIPLNLALLKGCQIVGVFWGMFTGVERKLHEENMSELMAWYQEGKIKPFISKRYKLEEAVQALQDMSARKVVGKIVLTT